MLKTDLTTSRKENIFSDKVFVQKSNKPGLQKWTYKKKDTKKFVQRKDKRVEDIPIGGRLRMLWKVEVEEKLQRL